MAEVYGSREDEDELLQYAYLPMDVKKHYAIRYKGYLGDLPHFFLRHVSRDYRDVRAYCPTIVFNVSQSLATSCSRGDWIIGLPDGTFEVKTDDQFRDSYQRLLFMMNAD